MKPRSYGSSHIKWADNQNQNLVFPFEPHVKRLTKRSGSCFGVSFWGSVFYFSGFVLLLAPYRMVFAAFHMVFAEFLSRGLCSFWRWHLTSRHVCSAHLASCLQQSENDIYIYDFHLFSWVLQHLGSNTSHFAWFAAFWSWHPNFATCVQHWRLTSSNISHCPMVSTISYKYWTFPPRPLFATLAFGISQVLAGETCWSHWYFVRGGGCLCFCRCSVWWWTPRMINRLIH